MALLPFKDPAISDQYAEGLLKAGISANLNDHLPAFKENRLRGEEIKSLFMCSTLTEIGADGQQRWRDFKKEWGIPLLRARTNFF